MSDILKAHTEVLVAKEHCGMMSATVVVDATLSSSRVLVAYSDCTSEYIDMDKIWLNHTHRFLRDN